MGGSRLSKVAAAAPLGRSWPPERRQAKDGRIVGTSAAFASASSANAKVMAVVAVVDGQGSVGGCQSGPSPEQPVIERILKRGTAPVQGHISGVVDVPNACATLWLPTYWQTAPPIDGVAAAVWLE